MQQQQTHQLQQLERLLETTNRHVVVPFGKGGLRLTPLRRAAAIRTLRSLAGAIDVVVRELEAEA